MSRKFSEFYTIRFLVTVYTKSGHRRRSVFEDIAGLCDHAEAQPPFPEGFSVLASVKHYDAETFIECLKQAYGTDVIWCPHNIVLESRQVYEFNTLHRHEYDEYEPNVWKYEFLKFNHPEYDPGVVCRLCPHWKSRTDDGGTPCTQNCANALCGLDCAEDAPWCAFDYLSFNPKK